MVKTLIKRADGDKNDDSKSVGSNKSKRSRSSNVLLQKMNERLKEDLPNASVNMAEKVSNSNPLLKKLVNENKMDKYAKSSSQKSLVSDSALGQYVRTLKTELEKEKKAKDRALDILKKLHGEN